LPTMPSPRPPTQLPDSRQLEDALGSRLNPGTAFWVRVTPERWRGWLYRFALERGYLDALLVRFVVNPFVALFRWFDAAERRWTSQLNCTAAPNAQSVEGAPAANPAPAVTPVIEPLNPVVTPEPVSAPRIERPS